MDLTLIYFWFSSVILTVSFSYHVNSKEILHGDLDRELEKLKYLVDTLEDRVEVSEESNLAILHRLEEAESLISSQSATEKSVQRRGFTEAQVAFYAKLSGSLHGLSPHQTVIFDELVTNTSVGLYDTSTGIFTPPTSGMYVISWTANVNHQEAQSTELMVNGRAKAWAYADTAGTGDGDYGSASQTVVLQVNRNEKVWVRTGTNGKGDVHGADYSTFSAFLLFPHT